ncbi:hypothetical protein [Enterococcus sp. BWR-S5]|uniref:hypothetical protein n=1 Tax=Enterococcus sp. BWR-S5 TaxID=2787714 RepID=UPI0019211BB1|nr:hypothetical protein [Enterococcus sp. BWR-S5]MBL1226246.1 hypothetical protein [Enterococcus sp. BWR-S5]
MLTLGLYIFFTGYVAIRCILTIFYRRAEKQHSMLFYEEDKQLNEWIETNFKKTTKLLLNQVKLMSYKYPNWLELKQRSVRKSIDMMGM